MSSNSPLQVYGYPDLLILYWRSEEKIPGRIEILVDGAALEKPLLGAEFGNSSGYLLAAFARGIEARENFTVRIATDDSAVLAEAACKKLRPLPKRWLGSLSLGDRIRLEKALIVQLARVLPQVGAVTRQKLAVGLAEPGVTAVQGPDDLCYVRLPWLESAEPGLLQATLKSFAADRDEVSEPVLALQEGGYLHFFSRRAAARNRQESWMLDAGKIRCLPFLIKAPKIWAAGRSTAEWVDAIAVEYVHHQAAFRGFATAFLKSRQGPARKRSAATRLMGQVEGLRSGGVSGWAFDPGKPHNPVRLRFEVDGQELGQAEAHLPRPDGERRGYGNCGFLWPLDGRWMDGVPREIRVCCADTGEPLDGSPLRVGRDEYDGDFHLDEAGRLIGWVRERCATPRTVASIAVLIDGQPYAEVPAGRDAAPDPEGRCPFRSDLSDEVFDTGTHTVEVEAVGTSGTRRHLGRVMRIKADYRGHVDTAGPGRVTGWVVNGIAPARPVWLDVLVNGIPAARGKADLFRPDGAGEEARRRCGFDIPVSLQNSPGMSLTLDICLSGTQVRVLGPATLHMPYDVAIRTLATVAEKLNDGESWKTLAGGLSVDSDVTTWLRTQVVGKLLAELRKSKRIPEHIGLPLASQITLPRREKPEPIIDVIVPVYLGREDVLRCIASVLKARCHAPMELIVINDASPDPELNAELRSLAAAHRFVLLENPANLGFVGTVNRGMRLHPGRDVVLLNSDTAVAEGWLDRLRGAAYRAGNIGTATPFSNNATICSFPVFGRENPLPDGLSVETLDGLFARANAGQTVDLPTAIGFCMYIKRCVLDEVGYFDEGQWGKGYAEENDFCLKASALGWRHVAACDVFVEHKGGVSFGGQRPDQLKRNLAKLNHLYPDYAATIQRFIMQDPLAVHRNRIAKVLLRRHAEAYLLFLIHGLGGGTQLAADQLADRLAAEGVAVLELKPAAGAPDCWQLTCHGVPYGLQYRYPRDFDTLVQDLRDLGVWHIHYHQAMHFPKAVWDIPGLLGTAYDFTVHDYLPICPRINLIDESGVYCGDAQFSPETCTRCVRINGPHPDVARQYAELGGNVADWRAAFEAWLRGARRVFAPSEDAASRMQRHFPLLNLQVQTHPEPRIETRLRSGAGDASTVAVIGAIGLNKGYEILLRCARNAEKEGLPLKFAVIGFTGDDETLLQFGNVTITGRYQRDELPRLIDESRAKVAVFLSPWPETHCFALSEAWRSGLYPVAFDIGAVAERIGRTRVGRLIPLTTDPKTINRVLLEVLAEQEHLNAAVAAGRDAAHVLADYYGLERPRKECSFETLDEFARLPRVVAGGL